MLVIFFLNNSDGVTRNQFFLYSVLGEKSQNADKVGNSVKFVNGGCYHILSPCIIIEKEYKMTYNSCYF